MKLGFGLYRNMLTAESLRFARQVGATHIVAHPPGSASPANDALMAKYGRQAGHGLSDPNDPIWTYERLRDLKALVNSEGLELEALENFAPSQWYDVLLDGPRRAQQMERLKQLIRDLGRVGIPIMGYYFSVAGVWGQMPAPNARGQAMSVGYDDPAQPPIPAGMVWNMVYDTAKFDPDNTTQVLAPVSDLEIQQRFRAFINEMVPVAEEAGVRLALHPDDPPMPVLRGAHRLSYTPTATPPSWTSTPAQLTLWSCAWARWPKWPKATFTAWWKRSARWGASVTSISETCAGRCRIITRSLSTRAIRIWCRSCAFCTATTMTGFSFLTTPRCWSVPPPGRRAWPLPWAT